MSTSDDTAAEKAAKRREAAAKMLGGEPTVGVIHTNIDVIHALNWYNQNTTQADAEKWLKAWFKANPFDHQKMVIAKSRRLAGTTPLSLLRMSQNGFPLSDAHRKVIDAAFDKIVSAKFDDDDAPSVAKKTGRIVANGDLEHITDVLERHYEKVLTDRAFDAKSFREDLSKLKLTPAQCQRVRGYFNGERADVEDQEAIPDAKLRRAVAKMIESFLEIVGQIKQIAKKPRIMKKKPVKVEKLIARLKFLKEDTITGVKSVDPSKLIGAKLVWLYNAKARVLWRAVAEENATFGVKGTTLTGIDSEKSEGRRLRKPQEVLPSILGGPVVAQRVWEKIKTSPVKYTGRINSDTVIMKAG